MFWFTNWQRRILYNIALRCYDAMQHADACFVFWVQSCLAHEGAWPHTSTQTRFRSHERKVICLFNIMAWSVPANPSVHRIRDTKPLFPPFFSSSLCCELQTLWNATLPWPFTHTLNTRSGGGSACLYDDVQRRVCVHTIRLANVCVYVICAARWGGSGS